MFPDGYLSSHKRASHVTVANNAGGAASFQSPLQPRKQDFTGDERKSIGTTSEKKASRAMTISSGKNTVHFVPRRRTVVTSGNGVVQQPQTKSVLVGDPQVTVMQIPRDSADVESRVVMSGSKMNTRVVSKRARPKQGGVSTGNSRAISLHVDDSMHRSIAQEMRAEGYGDALETFSIMHKSGNYADARVFRDLTVQTLSQLSMGTIDKHVCALQTTIPLKNTPGMPYLASSRAVFASEAERKGASTTTVLDNEHGAENREQQTKDEEQHDDEQHEQQTHDPRTTIIAHPTIELPPSTVDENNASSKHKKVAAVYLQNYPVVVYPAHNRFRHEKVTLDVSLYNVPEGFCYTDGQVHFVGDGISSDSQSEQPSQHQSHSQRARATLTPISLSRKPSTLSAVRVQNTATATTPMNAHNSSFAADPLDISVAFAPTEIVAQKPTTALKPARRTVNAAMLSVDFDTIPMSDGTRLAPVSVTNSSINSPPPVRSSTSSYGSKVTSPVNDVDFSDEVTLAASPTSESDGSVRLPVSIFQLDDEDDSRFDASVPSRTPSAADLLKLDSGLVAGPSLGRMRAASNANLQTQHRIHTPTYSAGTANHQAGSPFQRNRRSSDSDYSSDDDMQSDGLRDGHSDDDRPFYYTHDAGVSSSSLTATTMMALAVQQDEIRNEWVEFEVVEVEMMDEDDQQVVLVQDNTANHPSHSVNTEESSGTVATTGADLADSHYSHEDSHSKIAVKLQNCLVNTGTSKILLIYGALHMYPGPDVYTGVLAEGESVYSFQEHLTVSTVTGQLTQISDAVVITQAGKRVKRSKKRQTTEKPELLARSMLRFIGTQVAPEQKRALANEIKAQFPSQAKTHRKRALPAVREEAEESKVVRQCDLIKGHNPWQRVHTMVAPTPPAVICHSPMSEALLDMKAVMDYAAAVLQTHNRHKDWISGAPAAVETKVRQHLSGVLAHTARTKRPRQVHGVTLTKHDLGGGAKQVSLLHTMDQLYWVNSKDVGKADVCVGVSGPGARKLSLAQAQTSNNYNNLIRFGCTPCVNSLYLPKQHSFLALSGITRVLDLQGMTALADMAAFKKVVNKLKGKEVIAQVSDSNKNEPMAHFPTNRKTGQPQYALVQTVDLDDGFGDGAQHVSETKISTDTATRHLLSTPGELSCTQPPMLAGRSTVTQLLGLHDLMSTEDNNRCGQCVCCGDGHRHALRYSVLTEPSHQSKTDRPVFRHKDSRSACPTGGRRVSIKTDSEPFEPSPCKQCALCGRVQMHGQDWPAVARGAIFDASPVKPRTVATRIREVLMQSFALHKIIYDKALNISKGCAGSSISSVLSNCIQSTCSLTPFQFSEHDRDLLLLACLRDIEHLAEIEIRHWAHSINARVKDYGVEPEELQRFVKVVGDICRCSPHNALPPPLLDATTTSLLESSQTLSSLYKPNMSVVIEESELDTSRTFEVIQPKVPEKSVQPTPVKQSSKKKTVTVSNSAPPKSKKGKT